MPLSTFAMTTRMRSMMASESSSSAGVLLLRPSPEVSATASLMTSYGPTRGDASWLRGAGRVSGSSYGKMSTSLSCPTALAPPALTRRLPLRASLPSPRWRNLSPSSVHAVVTVPDVCALPTDLRTSDSTAPRLQSVISG